MEFLGWFRFALRLINDFSDTVTTLAEVETSGNINRGVKKGIYYALKMYFVKTKLTSRKRNMFPLSATHPRPLPPLMLLIIGQRLMIQFSSCLERSHNHTSTLYQLHK